MNNNRRKGVSPLNKILITMVVILAIMGGVVWAKNTYFAQNNKEAIASDSLTEEELKAAKADLTVDLDAEVIQAAFPNVSREFLYSSMPSENRARVAALALVQHSHTRSLAPARKTVSPIRTKP